MPDSTIEGSAVPVRRADAPFVYFDSAPSYGVMGGVIEIEVAARILVPLGESRPSAQMAITGHLRCSRFAAEELYHTLGQALEMLRESESGCAGGAVN